jgi:hypothetical protein
MARQQRGVFSLQRSQTLADLLTLVLQALVSAGAEAALSSGSGAVKEPRDGEGSSGYDYQNPKEFNGHCRTSLRVSDSV